MRTSILKRAWRAFGPKPLARQTQGASLTIALLLAAANVLAAPTVNWLSGGPNTGFPSGAGYQDGDITLDAEYHTPGGIAFDTSGQYLFVADRDNNVIRILDFGINWTWTFEVAGTNLISKPIGVAVDGNYNVYVLNRGNGNNGSLVTFDSWGDVVMINATGLTNAAGLAMAANGDLYVTVRSNTLLRITGTNQTVVATVPFAGTSLQGIVVKMNGLIAACDSGRNGIYLIDPNTSIVTTNAGFHGVGDFTTNGNNTASASTAKFNQPMGVVETGDGSLIVTDYGNHRVKRVLNNGVVTNLYGVYSGNWVNPYKGFMDGTVAIPDLPGGVAARMPYGVTIAPDGSVYVTEDYYHIIRHITGAGLVQLPTPPPPPPTPPAPRIGWFDYEGNISIGFYTVLHPVTSAITLNNDALLAVDPNTNGINTYYISGTAPLASLPSATNGSSPPTYHDGLAYTVPPQVQALPVAATSNLIVRAVNVNSVGVSGPSASAQFIFQVANPVIAGNNGAQFTVSDITTNCMLYYTLDGTIPTNGPPSFGPIALTNGNPMTISINVPSNIVFQARAFRNGYYPSGIAAQTFTTENFVPNSISFGFASGEASSDFVASPGQTFYAPVTLTTLPGTVMDSLQFSLTVNSLGGSAALTPGAFGFQSMLLKPLTNTTPVIYTVIPPAMFVAGTGFTNLTTTNFSLNMLAVGWLEREGQTNLFNTLAQSLITYSIAHDDLFPNATHPNGVIVGGYSFRVPANAVPGDSYQIQIDRPTATTDGIGEPGSSIFILASTNGSLGGGAPNAVKNVIVGQRKYIAGDSAPFRWFNAGDFGNTNLESADVAQVFEAAVYGLNTPPPGTDLFDSMDAFGYNYVDNGYGYLQQGAAASTAGLYDGGNTAIDQVGFGDGILNVADVYVTFRRSLQTNLVWFRRYWTNDIAHGVSARVAELTQNVFNPNAVVKLPSTPIKTPAAVSSSSTNQPKVVFIAGDILTNAGQTVQIPITASIFGSYPLRVMMLNLTVVPLDGSPALTTPVSFAYNPALGAPWTSEQHGNGNYSAVWLNSAIAGLSNNVAVGTLTITIPANATSLSAYAVHFDHLSTSPNGLAVFPQSLKPGLITLSDRSASSYGDGIPDSWRLRYFLTLNNVLSQTNADADGDGVNSLQEYLTGTDPTDPASNFKNISTDRSAAQSSQDCVINWPSVIGKQYVVERSPSLSTPIWTAIGTNSGNGTVMEYHDTAGGGVRFYRLRVQ